MMTVFPLFLLKEKAALLTAQAFSACIGPTEVLARSARNLKNMQHLAHAVSTFLKFGQVKVTQITRKVCTWPS